MASGARQSLKTITINVTGDTIAEPDETFYVTLAYLTGTPLGTKVASGTILNDEAVLSIATSEPTKSEGDSGDTEFTFTVTRSGNLTGSASVDFAVVGWDSVPTHSDSTDSVTSNAVSTLVGTESQPTADASDFGGTLPSGTQLRGRRNVEDDHGRCQW